jgi:hypothetical protein
MDRVGSGDLHTIKLWVDGWPWGMILLFEVHPITSCVDR